MVENKNTRKNAGSPDKPDEPAPGEEAGATPETPVSDETPDQESVEKKLFDAFNSDFFGILEKIGGVVFVITACSTVLFIFLFNTRGAVSDIEDLKHLRSVELLMTLAATSLVIAIIGRSQNPAVLAFGIFLIGALIVPSGDIVRFALLATGSVKEYESFFYQSSSSTDLSGRSTDVANKIITELAQERFINTPQPEQRKIAIEIIEDEIRKEREITLLEQVRSCGALLTLEQVANDVNRWVYKYGKMRNSSTMSFF